MAISLFATAWILPRKSHQKALFLASQVDFLSILDSDI